MPDETQQPKLTGGCQCGAVRYALTATPRGTVICHCRMCQKAGGAPFMAYAGVPLANLVFNRGKPATYASSDFAERGFCPACGTPLTYKMVNGDRISVTLGSLDDPNAFAPIAQLGVEKKLQWFATLSSLPEKRSEQWMADEKIDSIRSNQHPDHET
jgi:hypothetical protein